MPGAFGMQGLRAAWQRKYASERERDRNLGKAWPIRIVSSLASMYTCVMANFPSMRRYCIDFPAAMMETPKLRDVRVIAGLSLNIARGGVRLFCCIVVGETHITSLYAIAWRMAFVRLFVIYVTQPNEYNRANTSNDGSSFCLKTGTNNEPRDGWLGNAVCCVTFSLCFYIFHLLFFWNIYTRDVKCSDCKISPDEESVRIINGGARERKKGE